MGRIGRAIAVVGVVWAATAPAAWASGEITDPCGPGADVANGQADTAPVAPWLDICGGDVSGEAGTDDLRAVRTVLHLDGDVESAPAAGLHAHLRFDTARCSVRIEYKLSPVGPAEDTSADGWCDSHEVACDPELPFIGCSEADLIDDPAGDSVTASVSANDVTIVFDPNELPSAPAGVEADYASGGTLLTIYAQTGVHVLGASIFPGGDWVEPVGPVPLG